MTTLPVALTIAGSDSGGGAGIQADIKAMQAMGCFAASAITAITAQNTRGVHAIEVLPPALIAAQIDAVAVDMRVAACKTGMLADVPTIETVAQAIDRHGLAPLVVDPVMIAKGGDALLEPGAIETMRRELVPRATLLTPNASEAARLSGVVVDDLDGALRAIDVLARAGARAVLVKGGHLPARRDPDDGLYLVDVLWDGYETVEIAAPWVNSAHTHGTGCTYAAAIAALLARGLGLRAAVRLARRYLQGAIAHGLALGGGVGPTDHFWFMEPGEVPWLRTRGGPDG